MSGIWRYQSTSIPLRLANAGAVIVLPLLAVERLGDLAIGGLLTAVALFPSIIAAPLVGAVLDRMRRPRLLLIGAAAVTAAAYASAAGLGSVPLPAILLALAVAGFVTPVYMGGLSSFATDNVENIRDAYAQDSLSYTIASVGGPALAALMMAATGSAQLGMLLLAGLALVGVVASLSIRMKAGERKTESIARTIGHGISYLTRHRPIMLVTLSGAVSQVGAGGLGVAAIAISLERVGTEEAAAWIVTAFAVGGLSGALAVAARSWTRRGPVWIMGMGFVGTGVALLFAFPSWPIGVVFVAVGLAGFFTAPANAAMLLLRDKESIPSARSQVFTIGAGLRVTAAAIGAALASAASGLDAGWLVLGMAFFWIVGGSILWFFPNPPARTGVIPVQDAPEGPNRPGDGPVPLATGPITLG